MTVVAEAPVRPRAEEGAVAVFGTWMITGLFLDGWAHEVNKPETFFSPWHAVLYSGFGAAVLWFMWHDRRSSLTNIQVGGLDGVTTVGLVLFVVGAVGDGIWHEIFGIEVDLEALLSPTHLLLLIGGFLMVTAPLRAAWNDTSEVAPTWSRFWPQALSLTLAVALISFFTMYVSAFEAPAGVHAVADAGLNEEMQVQDLLGVLVTNLLLIGAVLHVSRRWRTPRGTFTMLFGGVAFAVTGLEAFDALYLVVPALLAGAVADALSGRVPRLVLGGVVPAVLWAGYFAAVEVFDGLTWTPELWLGAIVLCAVAGVLLARLTTPRPEESLLLT